MNERVMQIFVTCLLAAFGALARLLSQKEKTAVQLTNMLSGCLVAAFAGIMANFVADYFGFDDSLTYIIAGISGWIGPQLLDVFANMVMKKSGIDFQVNTLGSISNVLPAKPVEDVRQINPPQDINPQQDDDYRDFQE